MGRCGAHLPFVSALRCLGPCLQIWDYESGSFEQTLRGHTNTVQCIAFDGSGDVLGA